MNSFFQIGVTHFLVLSFVLVAAGIATMLTKRNAIGILIGVELVLNAAAINLVAFNRYAHNQYEPQVTATAFGPDGALSEFQTLRVDTSVAVPDKGVLLLGGSRFASALRATRPATGSDDAAESPREAASPTPAPASDLPSVMTESAARTEGAGATRPAESASLAGARFPANLPRPEARPPIHGKMFAVFIIVLAAAEAAVALAIFLNFYNNFSSIDVDRADELRG